ncbi:MAG: Mur ligase domain-containing protein [Desulfosudis oleivorans]|nr:Mur ligase domain-containing protein [Desulfosudis oleivorans]
MAISGLKHDGHDYIADAASRGARYIVYEKDIQIPFGVKAIKVTNSRRALGVLAKELFRESLRQIMSHRGYGNKR